MRNAHPPWDIDTGRYRCLWLTITAYSCGSISLISTAVIIRSFFGSFLGSSFESSKIISIRGHHGVRQCARLTLALLTLTTASAATAGIGGDIAQCFVEGLSTQIEHHPARQPEPEQANASLTPMFTNAVTTPVTVTCPLNVHPALEIDGAVVEVVRLQHAQATPLVDSATATFSCALMTRSTDGGQASGRRINRNGAGLIYLPDAESTGSAAPNGVEARYRYIRCELPGYSAIKHFSTQVRVTDAAIGEHGLLLDALNDAARLSDDSAVRPSLTIDGFIPLRRSNDTHGDSVIIEVTPSD